MHKLYIPTRFIDCTYVKRIHVLQIVYIKTNCANFDPDLFNLQSHFYKCEEILMILSSNQKKKNSIICDLICYKFYTYFRNITGTILKCTCWTLVKNLIGHTTSIVFMFLCFFKVLIRKKQSHGVLVTTLDTAVPAASSL